MTIYIEPEYVTRIEDENKQLKQDKKAIYSIWKKAINRENNLIIDNNHLKERNYQLKQELFNLYLKHYN